MRSSVLHGSVLKGVGEEECAAGSWFVGSRVTRLALGFSRDITASLLPACLAVDRGIVVGRSLCQGGIGGPVAVHDASGGARLAHLRACWGSMAVLRGRSAAVGRWEEVLLRAGILFRHLEALFTCQGPASWVGRDCKCFRDGGLREGGTSWCTWTSTEKQRFDDEQTDMSRVRWIKGAGDLAGQSQRLCLICGRARVSSQIVDGSVLVSLLAGME